MRALSLIAALSAGTWALGVTPPAAAQTENAPATIRVNLPADATLTVDGQPTQATSATRWFTTPALKAGKRYFYIFKAEYVRDGATVTVERKVSVRPGRETVVSLGASGNATANNQLYYYNPQTPAPANTSYYPYFVPVPYYAGPSSSASWYQSEWTPGNLKMYNP